MAAKKAFGGYTLNWGHCDHTGKEIFGSGSISPSEMTKKLWAHAKKCAK